MNIDSIIQVSNSIKNRGLFQTLQIIYAHLLDSWFDIKYGTDTAGVVKLIDLKIDSVNIKNGVDYQPTIARHLKKILRTQIFPPKSVFVDLGSGKGRNLLVASQFNFKRVVGIEFSKELCNIAKKNVDIFSLKNKCEKELINIIQCDVAEYIIKHDENIFFLYNDSDRPNVRFLVNR